VEMAHVASFATRSRTAAEGGCSAFTPLYEPGRVVQRCTSCESQRWGLARGDRERSLNEGQIPNVRVVRVALGTGYHRVEGNRRASRNGRVSDLPPETATVTIRNFCVAVGWSLTNSSTRRRRSR
jgi:hypothetical protein